MSRRPLLSLTICALCAGSRAHAQHYAEDPTRGLSLPTTPIAGDHDARAVVANPAGIALLEGTDLELAVTGLDQTEISGVGAGLGFYLATPAGLPGLPRLGLGLGIERLSPPNLIVPDPGEPARVSLAQAMGSKNVAMGIAWHHYVGGGLLGGLDTFDLGLTVRLGARWAAGATIRNVFAPELDGVPVERRYYGELAWRPLADDRVELGATASVGDRRLEVDPRLRLGLRLMRGLYLRGEAGWVARWRLDEPTSTDATRERELIASLGLEVSMGTIGITALGTASDRFLGGTSVVRISSEVLPSVLPSRGYIAKIRLAGKHSERDLVELLVKMERLATDPAVAGVVLSIDDLKDGWGVLEELRAALIRLRQAGKRVFAFLVAPSLRDYFVAASSQEIFLDPAGGLRFAGLSGTVIFFKSLFDKIGVNAQFEKIEEYKSAPEAYTRTGPSPEAERMRNWLLDDIYGRVISTLAKDRGRTNSEMQSLVEGGPYTAAAAEDAKLVDSVVTPRELERLLDKELGRAYPIEEVREPELPTSWRYPRIAVIVIEGDIIDGKSRTVPLINERLVGGETIAAAIEEARSDAGVRAIILRINSPGGSALASEQISREVFATRGRKPIIVSMGATAASGGYFSAAGGDLIYADPSTITGSIGIFTGKFDLSELLTRVGLTWHTSVRGEHADMDSMYRPYTDRERVRIKEALRYYYGRFVGAVAKGRNLTEAQVEEVARGQVWTGNQALERRLVDRAGGFIESLHEAKQRGHLAKDQRVDVLFLPAEPRSLWARLLKLGDGEGHTPLVDRLVRVLPPALLATPASGIFARMPAHVEIE